MALTTVAILSPGDMGHSVGRVLRHGGLRVVTCLQGRSPRSAGLAAAAGIEDLPDDESVVREAQIILSIVAPAGARSVGERMAAACRATGASPLVADCNAVAPQTAVETGHAVAAAGGRFVDAGIVGGPPQVGGAGPRIYASGEHSLALAALNDHGLDIRPIGAEIGQASGLKMCYAAMSKGLTALGTELLVAAERLGLAEPLRAEMRSSLPTLLAWLERGVPSMPPKSGRWVAEMEEIAATFAAAGLTPSILQGAADMYRFVATTPLAEEKPETRDKNRTLDQVVEVLARAT